MNIYQAGIDYEQAKFATDWARGLCAYADNEFAWSLIQPVEYNALEETLIGFERAERDAWEELEYREREVRAGGYDR